MIKSYSQQPCTSHRVGLCLEVDELSVVCLGDSSSDGWGLALEFLRFRGDCLGFWGRGISSARIRPECLDRRAAGPSFWIHAFKGECGRLRCCTISLAGGDAENQHKFSELVEDCCCDYRTVNTLNKNVLRPLLRDLVKTPFFRYFKVKLWCDCPFWPDDGMCRLRDCSICECPEEEFPEPFKRPEVQLSQDDLVCQEGKPHSMVDRTLDKKAFRGWMETDNPWTSDNETDNAELTYVNLQLNPERYTGYTGPSARRIWESIYKDHCLKGVPGDAFPERHIFYKLISGLHSSISVHIASKFLLDETKDLWGPNPSLLYDRVLKYPERISNLYFTFLFVLRAVTKASEYLSEADYNTGNPVEDQHTHSLVNKLVNNKHLRAACPLPFDEAKLWKGQNGDELKRQMQIQFRNISSLIDCVGCEKCRLWGKLQILGLGTALKILFSVDDKDSSKQPLQLQRNEVIALINLLNQLSESVEAVHALAPIVEKSVKENLNSEPRIQIV